MKHKKALGLFLSFAVALCVVIPGTLAVEVDSARADGTFLIGGLFQDEGDASEPEITGDGDSTGIPDSSEIVDGEVPADDDSSETPDASEPEVPADGDSSETPDASEPEVPADGDSSENPDASEPEVPADGDTPADPEVPAGSTLFDRFMACETYEDMMMVLDSADEDELNALTEEELDQIEAKALALEPQPLPEIVIDEDGAVVSDEPADEPFVSEIIYPTVNFDSVAPFGKPVVGDDE